MITPNPEFHIRREERMRGERANYDQQADDVANLINPRKSTTTKRAPGEEYTQQIYDSTPARAAQKCASGIFAYTIQGAKWFALKPRNKDLANNDGVKRFYSSVTEELLGQIMASNFPRAIYEALQDFVTMPAGCIYLEEGGTNGLLNFQTYAFGSYVVANSADGIVDTMYRRFRMTPRQAIQKWKRENLHAELIKAADDDKKCDELFDFLHCVYPRGEYDSSKRDKLNMPFASEYIDVKNKHKISEGGYQEFPYFVARFNKNPEDVYGHSPGMDMLPDIRGLQKIKQTMLIATEKHVNPPWLIPDDGVTSYNWSSRAGSKNYWKASAVGNFKPEPVQIQSDLQAGFTILQEERLGIRDGFFLDIFTLLEQQQGKMTATEVLKRLEEALNQLAPTWGNLNAEWYGPIIRRALGICARNGAFNAIELPAELEQSDFDYDVQYLSKIALASEMIKARSFFQFTEAVTPLIAAWPEFAEAFSDTIKAPESLRMLAYSMGLPIETTYSEEETEERAQARADARAQQAAMQQAEQAASAIGKLPEQAVTQAIETAA